MPGSRDGLISSHICVRSSLCGYSRSLTCKAPEAAEGSDPSRGAACHGTTQLAERLTGIHLGVGKLGNLPRSDRGERWFESSHPDC